MKKIFYLLMLALCLPYGCGKNTPDCFQGAGDPVAQVWDLPPFDRIVVYERIRLVVRQGDVQEVRLESGKNLLPEISAAVVDGTLELRNENACNLFRPYGETTFYVTVPELQEIRSSTGLPIESAGPLNFSNLSLVSESFNNPATATTDGTFDLEFSGGRVSVVANGIAYFQLRGAVDFLGVTVAAGDSRVEAAGLQAATVRVSHRGSNAVEVFPTTRIEGQIRGYGDVRSYNRPPEVEVTELFRGRLVFVGE
ncbi:DUF2807 domain-containing protein [Robiginitalea sp. M366]|uniref:head GIN domain-containing protein n=1 Tax=Robiginitalea aestuariiviva TaxID=3036903 RepID=UPI00240DBFCA|nr:head GIN domain-containing protein [Robiginitalea aestuariiviva]MDG1570908.1 DUF2807 domain-containing protein [Robiginitalea aestuariiviva]